MTEFENIKKSEKREREYASAYTLYCVNRGISTVTASLVSDNHSFPMVKKRVKEYGQTFGVNSRVGKN